MRLTVGIRCDSKLPRVMICIGLYLRICFWSCRIYRYYFVFFTISVSDVVCHSHLYYSHAQKDCLSWFCRLVNYLIIINPIIAFAKAAVNNFLSLVHNDLPVSYCFLCALVRLWALSPKHHSPSLGRGTSIQLFWLFISAVLVIMPLLA